MSEQMERLFGETLGTQALIEKYEQDNNAVVLFGEKNCVVFAPCKSEEPGNDAALLALMVDGMTDPIVFEMDYIEKLKDYLNENF